MAQDGKFALALSRINDIELKRQLSIIVEVLEERILSLEQEVSELKKQNILTK